MAALRVLMDPDGFAVAPKKLTLSTVGILPALEKLMQEPVRPNLAISLHAPNKALRRELMPIEERYDIEDVIAAAQRYPIPRGGVVTYEYVLLGGVNDQPAHARALVRLLAGSRGKVNLIPLNPAPEIPFAPPTRGGRRRVLPHPLRRARDGLRAPAARAGHPRRLRPAPPQARGGAASPLLSRPERIPRVARLPPALAGASRSSSPSRRRPPAVPRRRAAGARRDLLRGRRRAAWSRRGDWLVPRYRGEPFFDKPALTYWLMAAAFRAFGFSPGAARLVSGARRPRAPRRHRVAGRGCCSTGAPPLHGALVLAARRSSS